MAQSPEKASVSGRIKSKEGDGLAGITIYLKGTDKGALTDSSGNYQLTEIESGTYTLIFKGDSFLKDSVNVTLNSGQNINVDKQLVVDARELNAVTVEGKAKTQEIRESGFNVNAIDTKQYANSTSDLNQVLNRSTGIRVREEGGLGSGFNFSINGLSGKQVKFFLDGIPMETFGSSLTLNNIPVNLIDRIEVYKGVVPVSLGSDALGGAVNIVTSQKVSKYLDASYSYGSFNTHRAAVSGQWKHDSTGFVIKANAFYNYSDNNYLMKGVEVIENNKFVKKDLKRFHDQYQSSMFQFETGFVNRKWADAFLLGLLYSSQFKELQTGANQEAVIGGATTTSNYLMPTIKFSKENLFIKGLSTNLFGTYATDKIVVNDTSSSTYGWDGKPITTGNGGGEVSYQKSIYHYTNTFTMARINMGYKINEVHSFNLNYVVNNVERKGYNELNLNDPNNVFEKPNKLGKSILGAAYQIDLFKQRWTTTLLGKNYDFNALARRSVYYNAVIGNTIVESSRKYNFWGYGIASRFKLSEATGIKASFEHTYRLPETDEIFGDGRFVLGNIDLKPEESDNINFGAYYFKKGNRHSISVEASWFYRIAKDFIYFIPGVKFSSYDNAGNVLINGVEGDIKYNYKRIFSSGINVSYQNAINNSEYITGTKQKDVTYLDRIPNQPYLFGNLELGLGKDNLLGKSTRIQFTWFTQYFEQYYLTWASLGSSNSKNTIPRQLIHNASITYSLRDGRYNISLESRNLTDALAYDNFRLQKPGRSFYVKLRYFIK